MLHLVYLLFNESKMYCIFFLIWGCRNILYTPPPTVKNNCLQGQSIKIDVTEMIHLLTFQSTIKQCIVFFLIWGGIEIFLHPHLIH